MSALVPREPHLELRLSRAPPSITYGRAIVLLGSLLLDDSEERGDAGHIVARRRSCVVIRFLGYKEYKSCLYVCCRAHHITSVRKNARTSAILKNMTGSDDGLLSTHVRESP